MPRIDIVFFLHEMVLMKVCNFGLDLVFKNIKECGLGSSSLVLPFLKQGFSASKQISILFFLSLDTLKQYGIVMLPLRRVVKALCSACVSLLK